MLALGLVRWFQYEAHPRPEWLILYLNMIYNILVAPFTKKESLKVLTLTQSVKWRERKPDVKCFPA